MVEYLRMNGIVPPATVERNAAARVVDLSASDGTPLKASYFDAAKPGPAVLLLHQGNRDRKSWDAVAARLAAAGIHVLTFDRRGFGDSGGTPHEKWTSADRAAARKARPDEVETAWKFLLARRASIAPPSESAARGRTAWASPSPSRASIPRT
jgi:pimeloyl-ACP methyl ester carboxylesterase